MSKMIPWSSSKKADSSDASGSSAAEKAKHGFSTAGKIGLLGAIGIGLGIRGVKNALLGDSPSTLRKVAVYGTVLSSIMWWSCEDDIKPLAKQGYNWYQSEQRQHLSQLEETVTKQHQLNQSIAAERDSLYNLTQDLAEEMEKRPVKTDTVTQLQRDTVRYTEHDTVTVYQTDVVHVPEIDTFYVEKTDTVYVEKEPEVCWKPVRTHQRLSDLAQKYGANVTALTHANGLDSPHDVPVGFPLQLPTCPRDVEKSPLPTYQLVERNDQHLQDQLEVFGDNVLQYNQEQGNELDNVPKGYQMAVYIP